MALASDMERTPEDLGSKAAVTPACRIWHDPRLANLPGRSILLVDCRTSVPSRCVPRRYQGSIVKWEPGSTGLLGPRGTKEPMTTRKPVADGQSAGLVLRITRLQGPSRTWAPSSSRGHLLPGPMLAPAPWIH